MFNHLLNLSFAFLSFFPILFCHLSPLSSFLYSLYIFACPSVTQVTVFHLLKTPFSFSIFLPILLFCLSSLSSLLYSLYIFTCPKYVSKKVLHPLLYPSFSYPSLSSSSSSVYFHCLHRSIPSTCWVVVSKLFSTPFDTT